MGVTNSGHIQNVKIRAADDLSYIPIGNIRNSNWSIRNDVGDVTTKDSLHQREYDPTAFLKLWSISFSGLENDSAGYLELELLDEDGANVLKKFEITYGDGSTEEGEFVLSNFNVGSGEANTHEGFDCQIQSNGAIA